MTLKRLLAEANAAKVEIAHKTARATTLKAATDRARRKLRLAVCFYDH